MWVVLLLQQKLHCVGLRHVELRHFFLGRRNRMLSICFFFQWKKVEPFDLLVPYTSEKLETTSINMMS
jgi:hypothetical protein